MIFTQRTPRPMVAPTTTIATGAKNAICSSEYFVTQVPTSQIARTTMIIGSTSFLSTVGGYPSIR